MLKGTNMATKDGDDAKAYAESLFSVTGSVSSYIKQVANEPSMGLFYMQEHVRKSAHSTTETKKKLDDTTKLVEVQQLDVDEAMVMTSTMQQLGPSVLDRMEALIARASESVEKIAQSNSSRKGSRSSSSFPNFSRVSTTMFGSQSRSPSFSFEKVTMSSLDNSPLSIVSSSSARPSPAPNPTPPPSSSSTPYQPQTPVPFTSPSSTLSAATPRADPTGTSDSSAGTDPDGTTAHSMGAALEAGGAAQDVLTDPGPDGASTVATSLEDAPEGGPASEVPAEGEAEPTLLQEMEEGAAEEGPAASAMQISGGQVEDSSAAPGEDRDEYEQASEVPLPDLKDDTADAPPRRSMDGESEEATQDVMVLG